jgi:hypothetical protein
MMRARVTVFLAALFAAPPVFTPVQPELLASGGSFANAWADFDRDGDLDLFVGFNGEPNRLYRDGNCRCTRHSRRGVG